MKKSSPFRNLNEWGVQKPLTNIIWQQNENYKQSSFRCRSEEMHSCSSRHIFSVLGLLGRILHSAQQRVQQITRFCLESSPLTVIVSSWRGQPSKARGSECNRCLAAAGSDMKIPNPSVIWSDGGKDRFLTLHGVFCLCLETSIAKARLAGHAIFWPRQA